MTGVSRYEVGTVLAYGYCLPTGVSNPRAIGKASGFLGLLDVIESDLGGYTAACGSTKVKVSMLPCLCMGGESIPSLSTISPPTFFLVE